MTVRRKQMSVTNTASPMQNYIFVDIDGPLLPGRSHLIKQNREFFREFNNGMKLTELLEKHPPAFDPWCVRAHNLLARYGNARIVIVSNWRRWASISEIQQLFEKQGLEFNYTLPAGCMKRGLSSERIHDVACHISEYLPPNSRALVIDDESSLLTLNEWFTPDNDSDSNLERLEKNIEFKLLHVDYNDGLSYRQFCDGAEFLNIDMDQLRFEEFGIPILTQEEKDRRRSDFGRYYSALIV